MKSEHSRLATLGAVRALAHAARALERAAGDLTLSQYRVLMIVGSSPERASRLAERALVSRPSLTGVIDILESRGYLRRVHVAGDRRGVVLELTPAGRTALDDAEVAMAAWLEDVAADTPSAVSRTRMMEGLGALGAAMAHRHDRLAVGVR